MAKERTVGSPRKSTYAAREFGGESVSAYLLGSRLAIAEVYANESINEYWTSLINQNVADFMCDSEALASWRVPRVNQLGPVANPNWSEVGEGHLVASGVS